jgi:exodeoxyribonuclease VII large subunit
MLEILMRRWPALEVWVRPVPVQGEGAGAKIAEAIDQLNRLPDIDVLIVGRGGGSLEDLWPFNEEVVADAIFRSRIPVVSGVGHETDLTIADLVADVRALTPSEAAEKVTTPSLVEVLENLDAQQLRLKTALLKRLDLTRVRLNDLSCRRCFRQPLERIHEQAQRLDERSVRLHRSMQNHARNAQQRLSALAARLETLSPLNVLARGYSLTRKTGETTVLREASRVQPGDRIVTRLQHGEVISRVEETTDGGVS